MYEIVIIIALIILNGILAMSEIALISVKKSNLTSEDKNGGKAAKTALKLANNPDKFLSTIQIGITVIGILTGIYSGSVLADNFAETLVQWGFGIKYAPFTAQAIIVTTVTYFTIIFGELVPKRIGMSMADKVAKIVAKPMLFLATIASPFVWILSKSSAFFFNSLSLKSDSGKVTEEEIKSMIEEGAKDGEVQEVEQDIVERVFMLGDLRISSLMTHRSDVISLDISMSKDEIKEVIQQNLYQLYPVIDRNFDNVKGVITLKDLMFKFDANDFNIQQIIKPVTFFNENMSVYNALEHMKQQRISQALICDEFGSCLGIITLKDILEGLVGTIADTHSEPDIIKRKEGDGWLVNGQCPFHDLLSFFEIEALYADSDYNTVSGLILEQLKHIPVSGESTEWKKFKFEIVDMDGVRIDKILVTLITEHNKDSL